MPATQYSLAAFDVEFNTTPPGVALDASCATGTVTESADSSLRAGVPTACEPYPPDVYTGTKWSVAIDGADDSYAGLTGVRAWTFAHIGEAGTITLTPKDAAADLPTVVYTVTSFLPAVTSWPVDGVATMQISAMPLSGPPTITPHA